MRDPSPSQMGTRPARGTPKRVWVVSGAVAVLVHVALFALWPDQKIVFPETTRTVAPLKVTTERPVLLSIAGTPMPEVGTRDFDRTLDRITLPHVWNEAVLQGVLARVWPPELWGWGEGGRATVLAELDRFGRVRTAALSEGTGDDGLDAAFLELARAVRFHAVQWEGTPVPATVELSILVDPVFASVVPNLPSPTS